MKIINLVPEAPFSNYLIVKIMDEGNNRQRQRCKISVDFCKADIENLKDKGYNLEDSLKYYKDYIKDGITFYLGKHWKYGDGLEEVVNIIEDKINIYYK